ncbi:MAG: hypothetical protein C0599_03225 [Salinivirgaceae bacterium]|nr:MAG: hypothetical protein C0599_03225 [Salinivirgaceae bacterium]
MSYSIEIDHVRKIVIHRHKGNIQRSELGDFWRELLAIKEFTERKYNLLTDYRKAKFSFSDEELEPVDTFLKSIKHIIDGKRNAVIVNDPDNYALTLLVGKESAKQVNFHVNLFSTEKAAFDYLM